MKHTSVKPAHTKRTAIPVIKKGEGGEALLMCPFCVPSHPLRPDKVSACGTILILTAEQTVFRGKYEKKMVCVKCGKHGGDMILFQGAFVHNYDCSPGVVAMTEAPEFSDWAARVAWTPEWIRKPIEKFTGRAQAVEEVLPDGTRTGVVLGYFFHKEVKNGKQTPIHTGQ
jgi:hypothetical protein